MVDRNTESYCQLLQFVRDELPLNVDYANIQIITDFEQGLRNAIARVLPEANNSGCWFHYIQVLQNTDKLNIQTYNVLIYLKYILINNFYFRALFDMFEAINW